MQIKQRPFDQEIVNKLIAQDINPLLARLFAARAVQHKSEIDYSLNLLISPEHLTNNTNMATLLADAIALNKKILIIGDYDADGATATAVAVKGLRLFAQLLNSASEIDKKPVVNSLWSYGLGQTK